MASVTPAENATARLRRRMNFDVRYAKVSGLATTGSCPRYRRRSSAIADTDG